MEARHSDQSLGEPIWDTRPKIESDVSTSSKPEIKDPFLSLPSDIFTKIIGYIPIAQWPELRLVDKNFRATILLAWRKLRNINIDRELVYQTSVTSALQKLADRSPFLTSLSGISIQSSGEADTVQSLAQFEHLRSISLDDASRRTGIPLGTVVDFLESTRSRTSLKELRLYNIVQRQADRDAIVDNFASSFIIGREVQFPLKLEKLSFAAYMYEGLPDIYLRIRFDTLDATRLTELRLRKAPCEPEQLIGVIQRASNLHRIELSFLNCFRDCSAPRLQGNRHLFMVLASHEHLTAIKFESRYYNSDCKCLRTQPEFIEMLKSIGRRGRIRQLAVDGYLALSSTFDMNHIGATIRVYIPYLQSLKIHVNDIGDGSLFDIVSLTKLEDLHLSHWIGPAINVNAMRTMAQLHNLKRLFIDMVADEENKNSLEWLADVTTLTDLRIRQAFSISAEVFEKWSEGFASNLRTLMLGEILDKTDHDENGLARLLKKATQLRVLVLNQCIADQTLQATAESCPKLETLLVRVASTNEVTIQCLQGIVDRCPNLKRFGGIGDENRNQLQFPKYRKISGDVDTEFSEYDFDDDEYD